MDWAPHHGNRPLQQKICPNARLGKISYGSVYRNLVLPLTDIIIV
jgi:hypothetical protein